LPLLARDDRRWLRLAQWIGWGVKRHEALFARMVLAVYVAGFAIGVMSHGRDFWTHGWRPYRSGVVPLDAFWTALVVLDALVIGLLLTGRRRSGLLAALTIMTFDVAANSYALFGMGAAHFAGKLVMQAAFFGFVAGSIAFVWPQPKTSAPKSGSGLLLDRVRRNGSRPK